MHFNVVIMNCIRELSGDCRYLSVPDGDKEQVFIILLRVLLLVERPTMLTPVRYSIA